MFGLKKKEELVCGECNLKEIWNEKLQYDLRELSRKMDKLVEENDLLTSQNELLSKINEVLLRTNEVLLRTLEEVNKSKKK